MSKKQSLKSANRGIKAEEARKQMAISKKCQCKNGRNDWQPFGHRI
ncbi:MAG: hypothetical protein IIT40_04035 [Prevotella sp.]|nr:hypothetical protein [Prevotella sp.]